MYGPIASYEYKFHINRAGRKTICSAVGPGWQEILEALDTDLAREIAKNPWSQIKILQIKEKFGGLRIYYTDSGLDEFSKHRVSDLVMLAEVMSFQTCEKCGSKEGVETRSKSNTKFSRTLTLCAAHHKERDENPTFQLGNGDQV